MIPVFAVVRAVRDAASKSFVDCSILEDELYFERREEWRHLRDRTRHKSECRENGPYSDVAGTSRKCPFSLP